MIINIVALEMLGDRMPKLGAGRLFFEVIHGVGKKSLPRQREEGEQSCWRQFG